MNASTNEISHLRSVTDDVAIESLAQRDDLMSVMAGANVGLALFDSNLNLMVCNQLYRTYCGYTDEDLKPGATLESLIRTSLSRNHHSPEEIEQVVRKSIARLAPGETYSFSYTSLNSRQLTVGRHKLQSGSVVETIREVSTEANLPVDLNSQFSQIASAARERMMHALDVMPDGFALFDAQDRLVVYNRQFVDLCPHVADIIIPGVGYEELLRQSVMRGAYDLNDLDAESYIAQRLDRHFNPSGPFELKLSDDRWVLISERKTSDGGIVKVRSDITEIKHREFDLLRLSQKLHSKNVHFDSALNNMVQGLCMFDKEQNLIVCNRRYLEMYGFSAEIVKPGINLREILNYSVSLGNYTDDEAQRALSERRNPTALSQRVTIKQRLRDGRVIAVMNEPMADHGTIATYQDVTEAEHFAEQTQKHLAKLEQSNQELQEFAYVASHDLQEPLRKIEAFGDRLSTRYGETLPDDGRMFIDRMQNAATRMRRLINDLLSYSRVTSKAEQFHKVDLNEVLAGVLSDLQIRLDETSAVVTSDTLPEIDADPTQMRMLFQNLLSNALKFRKADVKPEITISTEVLDHLSGSLNGPTVRITVADNGIGFDNVYKHQMFKIFQRLHGRLEYEGTGVGLATVRKIVDRHGGTLDADGEVDVGAKFLIDLPVNNQNKD